GERPSLAIERQVSDADRVEVAEARLELLFHALALRVAGGEGAEALERFGHGQRVPRREVQPGHAVRERGRVEAGPVARLAEGVLAVPREKHADVHLVRARLEPLEPCAHARVLPLVPGPFAVENERALFAGELRPLDGDDAAEPAARFAGAEGGVVREEPRTRRLELTRTRRAHEPAAHADVAAGTGRGVRGRRSIHVVPVARVARGAGLAFVHPELGVAVAVGPRRLDRLLKAARVGASHGHAVDDHFDPDAGRRRFAGPHFVD